MIATLRVGGDGGDGGDGGGKRQSADPKVKHMKEHTHKDYTCNEIIT